MAMEMKVDTAVYFILYSSVERGDDWRFAVKYSERVAVNECVAGNCA